MHLFRKKYGNLKGKFDPADGKNVKHTHIGVWDLYEEIQPELSQIPGSARFETYFEMMNSLPYVWRMIKDIGTIRACWSLLVFYLVVELVAALVPAVSLW